MLIFSSSAFVWRGPYELQFHSGKMIHVAIHWEIISQEGHAILLSSSLTPPPPSPASQWEERPREMLEWVGDGGEGGKAGTRKDDNKASKNFFQYIFLLLVDSLLVVTCKKNSKHTYSKSNSLLLFISVQQQFTNQIYLNCVKHENAVSYWSISTLAAILDVGSDSHWCPRSYCTSATGKFIWTKRSGIALSEASRDA